MHTTCFESTYVPAFPVETEANDICAGIELIRCLRVQLVQRKKSKC